MASEANGKERQYDELVSNDGLEEMPLKAYPRRWFVLSVASVAIALRGYNQSCYGPINDVYSKYFDVEPWQVDWLIIIQSVIFLVFSLPMSLLTTKLGYKLSVILVTSTLTVGFVLTSVGVTWRGGFGTVLVGQAVMGFSNIISWSLPPATAAIWFPKQEVATAVAFQVVGRGIGEAIGSFLPTVIMKNTTSDKETSTSLVYMFAVLSSVACLLAIFSISVVKDFPPTPPSEAQAKIVTASRIKKENAGTMSTFKQFTTVVKSLFANKIFIAVWFVFGAVNPILRNNNVLLTSVLHHQFSNSDKINTQSGIVLLVAWSMYTLGGFIAGPLITKTKRYKEVVMFSVISLLATCILILIGVQIKTLNIVYAAVMAQGLFIGMANTSLFELLAEVTYPVPPMFVTMVTIVILGLFRLTFPLLGRLMLKQVGPAWSTSFPIVMTFICSVIIISIKPTYYRERANQEKELQPLMEDHEDDL